MKKSLPFVLRLLSNVKKLLPPLCFVPFLRGFSASEFQKKSFGRYSWLNLVKKVPSSRIGAKSLILNFWIKSENWGTVISHIVLSMGRNWKHLSRLSYFYIILKWTEKLITYLCEHRHNPTEEDSSEKTPQVGTKIFNMKLENRYFFNATDPGGICEVVNR